MKIFEVDTLALKGKIIAKGFKIFEIYQLMGMTKRQWENRIENKRFFSDEIARLIELLDINTLEEICSIFFVEVDT